MELVDDTVAEGALARPGGGVGAGELAFSALASCRGRTDLFFPTYNERPSTRARREARAKRLCERCPVQDACRTFARSHGEYGLWGGETDEERVLAGVRLRYPYSPKTIKRERERLAETGSGAEPSAADLAALEAWMVDQLDLAS
jgi:WhiB family redox-sensing transcriptional regulator